MPATCVAGIANQFGTGFNVPLQNVVIYLQVNAWDRFYYIWLYTRMGNKLDVRADTFGFLLFKLLYQEKRSDEELLSKLEKEVHPYLAQLVLNC